MSEPLKTSGLLGEALSDIIRQAVREEIQAVMAQNGATKDLLTPEELSQCLKVPVSWVYEQSRQGKIPTHRIGRYIRFNLQEVLHSQKSPFPER